MYRYNEPVNEDANTSNAKEVEVKKMNLNQNDVAFIKENIENANELLLSNDPNDLIEALHDFTVFTMDDNDEITDIGRKAERIIDKIVYDD